MIVLLRRSGALGWIAFALAGALPTAALADSTTSISEAQTGFTSLDNTYGPWSELEISSANKSRNQSLGFDLALDDDQDRPNETKGIYGTIEYVRDLTPNFYAIAVVGYGSNGISPLPRDNVYLEGAYKLLADRSVVMTVAEQRTGYTHGIVSNQIQVGPQYFGRGFTAQAIWDITANTGSLTRSSAYVALDVNTSHRNESKVTATVQIGAASYESALPITAPLAFGNYTGTIGTLGTTQWLTRKSGIVVSGLYGKLSNIDTGRLQYIERAVRVGVVFR